MSTPTTQDWKDCVFALLHQFGYISTDGDGRESIYHGGLSTFEEAFALLGWPLTERHYLDTDEEWQSWLTR